MPPKPQPTEAELFKAELDVLFKKYPNVVLNVLHTIEVANTVQPAVEVSAPAKAEEVK